MATTPLEREILTHYWTTPEPYRGGPHNWTETHARIVHRFVEQGLLISGRDAEGRLCIRPNEEALRAYMDALAAVPLPVQRWVVPSGQESRDPPDDTPNRDPSGRECGAAGDGAREGALRSRLAELERQLQELQTPNAPRRSRYEAEED